MDNKLILDIAVSMIKARFKQSAVAAAGIIFGVGAFIALVSFMSGLNKLLDDLIVSRTPHIRLYNEIKPSEGQPVNLSPRFNDYQNFIRSIKPKDQGKQIYDAPRIIRTIKADRRVFDVAPKITTPVFFNAGTIELTAALNGVEALTEEKLFHLSDYIIKGDIRDLAINSRNIFIGKGIADKMLVDTGDVIRVTTASGNRTTLKVKGIIQFGMAEIDDTQSYTSLETAQKLEGKSAAYITDIQIKIRDMRLAPSIAKEYSRLFNVDAIDIQTSNVQFETGSSIRSIISYTVGITLLTVAGFGIYNILNMLIYEKMDAIAILKATGFSGTDVKWIFIVLAMIIGVSGGCLGLVLGYLLSVIISYIPFETQALPTIRTFPVNFNMIYYIIGISFAVVTSYIAGLFPARKAGDVDPVVIIRGK